MDCIPYINDLQLEIQILKDVKANGNCDVSKVEKQINDKQLLIEKCKYNLSKLSDNQICYRIYLNMLNGMSVSKSIDKVAEENGRIGIKPTDIQTLWVNYYRKIKKILQTK